MKLNLAVFGLTMMFVFLSCSDSQENEVPKTVAKDNFALMKIGEGIFKTNCTMCHAINKESDKGNAPVLDSVKYHWPDQKKLGAYIRNAKENLNADAYTTALYERFKGKLQMPPFEGLTDEEVEGIIIYLHSLSS